MPPGVSVTTDNKFAQSGVTGTAAGGCAGPRLIVQRGNTLTAVLKSPRLCSRALAPEQMSTLVAADHQSVLAAWDFSIGIQTNRITDVSANALHGELVNLPTRAVAGSLWNGEEHCWSQQPEHYAAIHFHDDDLYDCGWETDFELTIPDDLPSAVYALHLHGAGESYYMPFAVRPPRGKTTAPVAFLLPTASYIAYANNRIGIDVPETEIVAGRLIQLNPDRRVHAGTPGNRALLLRSA